mmetsp:Transcript_21045/g.38213  ORF Transcript_21045/g.38213 Transcript_21045/m.38213 type:complete len:104 (-) Transcript_21045:295-606(-)
MIESRKCMGHKIYKDSNSSSLVTAQLSGYFLRIGGEQRKITRDKYQMTDQCFLHETKVSTQLAHTCNRDDHCRRVPTFWEYSHCQLFLHQGGNEMMKRAYLFS